MEVGKLWESEKNPRQASEAFEKALSAVTAMHGNGEASADALKLLLHSLRALAASLEAAKNWRRAEVVYTQLRSLTSRLLGKQHKATKAAALRAKRAAERALTQPESPPKEALKPPSPVPAAESPTGGASDFNRDTSELNLDASWLQG